MSNKPVTQVLNYDDRQPINERHTRGVLPGYCLGILLSAMGYSVVSAAISRGEFNDPIIWCLNIILFPLGFAVLTLLPAVMGLGTALWIKQKTLKAVRFSGFRTAFLWGIIGGLYPIPMLVRMQEDGFLHLNSSYILFGMLPWHLCFSAVAGLCLCRQSQLRHDEVGGKGSSA